MHDIDDPLIAALSDGTPDGASAGFTKRVLARYAARRRRRTAMRGVTVVTLLAVAAGFVWMRTTAPGVELELRSLQEERQQLVRELAQLEELTRTTRPVAWVRAGEELDLVLDLRQLDMTTGFDPRPARHTSSPREP